MGTALRPGTAADLGRLFKIDQLCFRSGIAYSRAELAYYLRHPRSFTWVAVDGSSDEIQGFAIAQCIRSAGNLIGHLITIDVLPAFRQRGVGTLLLECIERELQSRGAVSLRLEVAADNEAAQLFYGRAGYLQTGRIPGYYLNTVDAQVMEKAIAE